jgi:hypothetical protein
LTEKGGFDSNPWPLARTPGQLNQYLESTERRLGVLLSHAPAAEVKNLLDSLDIGAIWPFGDGFRDSAGGTFTRSQLTGARMR